MSAGEARRNDGSGEYAYEFLMSDEERQRYDRQQRAALEARVSSEQARLASLEQRLTEAGLDIFGRPLVPQAPQADAEAEM